MKMLSFILVGAIVTVKTQAGDERKPAQKKSNEQVVQERATHTVATSKQKEALIRKYPVFVDESSTFRRFLSAAYAKALRDEPLLFDRNDWLIVLAERAIDVEAAQWRQEKAQLEQQREAARPIPDGTPSTPANVASQKGATVPPATLAPTAVAQASNSTTVDMVAEGGVFKVPVQINGAITLKFVVDSGASSVQIPKDVFLTLVRAETIKEGDFLPGKTFILADGSKVKSDRFVLRSIKVGESKFSDVEASIGGLDASLLLGQSFLSRFKEWKIDNKAAKLILTAGTVHADSSPAVIELAKSEFERYSTKGHPKSKGTSFTLKYPKSWIAKEGTRPNIVQMFVSEQGRGSEGALIVTKALPLPAGTKLTQEDLAEILAPAQLKTSLPPNATFIDAEATKIEGEPAVILEYAMTEERAGMTVNLRVVAFTFFQGTTMVQVQFSVSSLAGGLNDLPARAAAFRPLFDQMMNSIVFDDKWK